MTGKWVLVLFFLMGMIIEPTVSRADPSTVIYDTVDGKPLHLLVWNGRPAAPGAALLMFHGGGFRHGEPKQFGKMCELLSQEHHMTCASVEYTLTGGEETLGEAKAAVAWIRKHAVALSVDPQKIAVGGSSAGAYLAASTAILNDGHDPASLPNALIFVSGLLEPRASGPSEQLGSNIRSPLPPTLLLHGTADHLVAIANNERFVAEAKAAGSPKIELIPFPGRDHGAFNYSEKGPNDDFLSAKDHIAAFLAGLGWISPDKASLH